MDNLASAPTPSNQSQPRRAAVIGSGFGGMAVAIRLQNAGFQTTLFEALDKPGGRAYVFEKDGYTFDGGPTVITAPHCLEELFSEAGRSIDDYVELLPVAPFYRLVWDDGDQFDYVGDSEAMVEQIRQRNPEDAEGYLKFVEYSRRVFDAGYTDLAHTPFLKFSDMVKVAPELMKLRADRSVYKAVARYIKNDHVRQALSFHSLLVGGNPYDTSAIYTLIHYLERKWGVFFPRGGTGSLVRGLVKLFEDLGGEIRLSSPVRSVSVDKPNGHHVHRVTTDAVENEAFDVVVTNADIQHTYGSLYKGVEGAEARQRKVEKYDWSMSLFVLYFGADRTYNEHVEHHTVVFGPRYKGLLDDIFKGAQLPDDFSLYLHAPTKTDPSLAPEGHGAFYVLSPVPHLGNAPDIDWSEAAAPYAERILESLEKLMPDLRQHVTVKHWITPEYFRDTLNSYHGSAFSCAPRLTQSAWFRPHNKDPRIPGLYLVGAGTHPGAGVPGVVNSAKATASLIVEDFSE